MRLKSLFCHETGKPTALKVWQSALVVVLAGVSILAAGCTTPSNAAQTAQQVATIQRGDITVDITSTGNLEFSHKEDLAFETAGTVKDVMAAAGDTVKEGQELATLDVTAWTDNITTLQRAVTTAQRALLQAEMNVTSATKTLAKDLVTYLWPSMDAAQEDIDNAQAYVDYAQANLNAATTSQDRALWTKVLAFARSRLAVEQNQMDAIENIADTEQVVTARQQLVLAQGKLADARTAVADAQKALDDARAASPLIKAPFAGFVTAVNVSGGEDVKKGAVAVELVDPAKFQAAIMVSERDIFSITVGVDATVQINAMPSINLPARVTAISPTATISSGVVAYEVEVELQSLVPLPPGQLGQLPSPTGQAPPSGQPVQLKSGLSVTVSIPIEQKTSVVLVPNRAVLSQGQNTMVRVIKNGVIESRVIKTGISNIQYTEVTDGLVEGEQVVIR